MHMSQLGASLPPPPLEFSPTILYHSQSYQHPAPPILLPPLHASQGVEEPKLGDGLPSPSLQESLMPKGSRGKFLEQRFCNQAGHG